MWAAGSVARHARIDDGDAAAGSAEHKSCAEAGSAAADDHHVVAECVHVLRMHRAGWGAYAVGAGIGVGAPLAGVSWPPMSRRNGGYSSVIKRDVRRDPQRPAVHAQHEVEDGCGGTGR